MQQDRAALRQQERAAAIYLSLITSVVIKVETRIATFISRALSSFTSINRGVSPQSSCIDKSCRPQLIRPFKAPQCHTCWFSRRDNFSDNNSEIESEIRTNLIYPMKTPMQKAWGNIQQIWSPAMQWKHFEASELCEVHSVGYLCCKNQRQNNIGWLFTPHALMIPKWNL